MATENLVLEGGAEGLAVGNTPAGPWTWTVTVPSMGGVSTAQVFAGSKSFFLRAQLTPLRSASMVQYFDVTPGFVYELTASYWVNGNPPSGSNSANIRFELDHLNDGFITPLLMAQDNPSVGLGWRTFSKTFTAQAPRCGLRVRTNPSGSQFAYSIQYHVDAIMIPFVPEPVILGPDVTLGDLIDNVAFNAGDFTSEYRASIRRWLNLVRSHCASLGFWKSALNGAALINCNGTDPLGVYALKDNGTPATVYQFIAGDLIFDVTNNRVLRYMDLNDALSGDANFDDASQASWWSDYGTNSAGEPLILIKGRPTAALDLRAPAYRQYTSITEQDESKSVDPYFGPVANWACVFAEGLRYWHEQDENEQGTMNQWTRFERQARAMHMRNAITFAKGTRLANIRPHVSPLPAVALADPGHFDNPEA